MARSEGEGMEVDVSGRDRRAFLTTPKLSIGRGSQKPYRKPSVDVASPRTGPKTGGGRYGAGSRVWTMLADGV